jgi:hypothetical protein
MRYRATWIATLIGVALCLFSFTGRDPHNIFFFMFSIPVWFVEMFGDVQRVSVWWLYALTVLSYAALGYLIDWGVARLRFRARP